MPLIVDNEQTVTTYGEVVRRLIERSKLTLKQVEEKCKDNGLIIDTSYISKIQGGTVPSIKVSEVLAKVLGTEPKNLVLLGFYETIPEAIKKYMDDDKIIIDFKDDNYNKGYMEGQADLVKELEMYLDEYKK